MDQIKGMLSSQWLTAKPSSQCDQNHMNQIHTLTHSHLAIISAAARRSATLGLGPGALGRAAGRPAGGAAAQGRLPRLPTLDNP